MQTEVAVEVQHLRSVHRKLGPFLLVVRVRIGNEQTHRVHAAAQEYVDQNIPGRGGAALAERQAAEPDAVHGGDPGATSLHEFSSACLHE